MKQIEVLEAEMQKTKSELEKMSDEYRLHKASLEELVLKSANLTSMSHEIKKARQLAVLNSKL